MKAEDAKLISCLWRALLQEMGNLGEIKLISIDKALDVKRIYRKE